MSRKAQAAMEFLMTYGWAILVVLVVIGALTYFGVLNPQTFVPSRCVSGETWLACKDYKLASGSNIATIVLENNWQYDISVTSLQVTEDASGGFHCDTGAITTDISAGAEATINTAVCSPAISASDVGKKVRADLNVTWGRTDVASPITHTTVGNVVAQVE